MMQSGVKKVIKSNLSIRHYTPFFLLAVVVLLIISLFSYKNTLDLQESQEEIIRSFQIKSEANYLFSRLAEARASQRDYLLTNNNLDLMPYENARSILRRSMRRMEIYASQSGIEQRERIADLQWSVNVALYFMEDALAFEQNDPEGHEKLLKKMADGTVMFNSVKAQVKQITQREDEHIRQHRLSHMKEASFTPFISFLLILLVLLSLILFFYQINEDITRLRKLNRELELSNFELNSFNHVTSHDLQEPLRKIETFISRLPQEEKKKLSSKSQEYLEKINTSANNMRRLIQDLLTFSQTTTEEKKKEMVSLATIVQEVITGMDDTIAEKKADVQIRGNLPEVYGIPFQLKQLFSNLIDNALKYADSKTPPQIEITARQFVPPKGAAKFIAKHYHQITIKDNGIGFDPQYAEKIFEIFQRLHSKDSQSGSGIGLAICKKIMDNHKGVIRAESQPGKGTSFHMYFPA